MSYIGNPPVVQASRVITELVATAGQTDIYPLGGYTPGDYLDVEINGSALKSTDYTATDGVKITLAVAMAAGDDVRVKAYGNFTVPNAYMKAEADARFAHLTGAETLAGDKTFSGIILPQAGIKFPAAQFSSSDANTLDDYEEGTWTPTLGGNATYTNREGGYVKIGRFVWLKFLVRVNTIGTGSNYLITGLPFPYDNTGSPRSSGACNYFAATAAAVTSISFNVDANGIFPGTTNGSTTGITDGTGIYGNGTYVMGSVTYMTSN